MANILSDQGFAERKSGEEAVESVSMRSIGLKLTGVALTASLLGVAPANAVETSSSRSPRRTGGTPLPADPYGDSPHVGVPAAAARDSELRVSAAARSL